MLVDIIVFAFENFKTGSVKPKNGVEITLLSPSPPKEQRTCRGKVLRLIYFVYPQTLLVRFLPAIVNLSELRGLVTLTPK